MKSVKFNKNLHKIELWMTPGLLVSRIKKFELSSIFSKYPILLNKSTYTVYRNMYNRVLRAAKRLYFDKEFEKNRSNLKKTWDLIKFAVNNNNRDGQSLSELLIDGICYTEPQIIAEKLNDFFISGQQKIANEILA